MATKQVVADDWHTTKKRTDICTGLDKILHLIGKTICGEINDR